MTLVSLPNNSTTGSLRDGQDYAKGSYVYANDKAMADVINGQLTDNNISASAAIQGSKIADNLDNKVLASPEINGNVTGTYTLVSPTISDPTISGNVTGTYTLVSPTISGDVTAPMLPPIGTIVPFYDYNALTFDTTYWAYCNGQTKTINGTSRVLPDLSGRYLVGFGTDGGTDNGSATWATAAVGNASHQANLSHTHTGPSHTHKGPSHTHTYSGTTSVSDTSVSTDGGPSSTRPPNTHTHTYSGTTGEGGTGNTGSSGTDNTGASGTGNTGSSLSSTQSIQPRSIRCRYLMRIQ